MVRKAFYIPPYQLRFLGNLSATGSSLYRDTTLSSLVRYAIDDLIEKVEKENRVSVSTSASAIGGQHA